MENGKAGFVRILFYSERDGIEKVPAFSSLLPIYETSPWIEMKVLTADT